MIRELRQADGPRLCDAMPAHLAEVAPDVAFSGSDFVDRLWRDSDRFAYGLFDADLAGFALVRGIAPGTFELSEFYIVPALRRGGYGTRLAHHALTRHPGRWQLGLAPGGAGVEFWPACLAACPTVGHIRRGPPLITHQRGSLLFTVKDPAP